MLETPLGPTPPRTYTDAPVLAAVASARGSGSGSSVSSGQRPSLDVVAESSENQVLADRPSAVRPPNRYRPLATEVPTASLSATGRARSVASVQPVSAPCTTVPWKTVCVGCPDASRPPMT